jgi:hypothetical protein
MRRAMIETFPCWLLLLIQFLFCFKSISRHDKMSRYIMIFDNDMIYKA